MKGAAPVGILIVAILVGAGVGYLVGNSSVHSVTTTTTAISSTASTLTVSSVTTMAAPSLELFAEVSPSIITEGQNISVAAEVFNPLSTNVTILLIGAPCGRLPTSYQIFDGHYDSPAALSTANPLLLYNESIIPPCFVAFNSTLVFQPNSDIANDSSFIGSFTNPVNYTDVLSGYYVPSGQLRNGLTNYKFQEFPPGAYTVLVEDAWGQQQLEYFTVNP